MTEDEYYEKLAKGIGQILHFRLNEPILAAQFEEFMDPKPAYLAANDKGREALNQSLRELSEALGAVPGTVVSLGEEDNQVKYDEYGVATIDEITNYFTRCRAVDENATMHLHLAKCAQLLPDVIELSKLAMQLGLHATVHRRNS